MTAFIFILLAASIVWGCKKTPDPDIDNMDLTEDRFVYAAKMHGYLIRYDVVDKKAVVACPDPLCGHDTVSCLATNVYSTYVGDDYIMYGRLENGLLGGYTMYCYDLKNGTITKVMDCPQYQAITFIGDCAYFSAAHVVYDENGKPTGSVWDVYWYTMASKELNKLNEESLASEIAITEYTDDRLVWLDYGAADESEWCFSTDYDFQNRAPETYREKTGDYIYDFQTVYKEDGSFTHSIYRKAINSDNWEEVKTGIFSYRLDNINDPMGMVYNFNMDGE